MRLEGRQAVVTGGARGIGAGIARCLAAEGARVAILDLDGEGAASTAAEIGKGSIGLATDAADEAAMEQALQRVAGDFGGLDILVNNAGAARSEGAFQAAAIPPITNLDAATWDDQLANNLRTTFVGAKAVIPHLETRGGGAIVNIASIAGLMASPTLPAYGAAKAGVIHLTRTLALELAPRNIRVNAICPGILWTRAWEMLTAMMKETNPALRDVPQRDLFLQVIARTTPLGREQTPEDIGKLVVFLTSDDARNITGQEIKVDGGITLAGAGGAVAPPSSDAP